jgi:hypothetical protein
VLAHAYASNNNLMSPSPPLLYLTALGWLAVALVVTGMVLLAFLDR